MIILALGGNLPLSNGGDVAGTFAKAAKILCRRGVAVVTRSGTYRSPPWPRPPWPQPPWPRSSWPRSGPPSERPAGQPDYLNAVWRVETTRPPEDLLATLHDVERQLGRDRSTGVANAARTLDLDLIDYDGQVSGTGPVLPHPRMHNRAFVLLPLAEIAPAWRHPVSRRSVGSLVAMLPDDHQCVRIGEAEST